MHLCHELIFLCCCFIVFVTILCASVYWCHVSAAAPDVTMLPQTQTHTRNESCEVELRLIRVTTYLQIVGGESCLTVTHQPRGTLVLLTLGLPLPTAN